MYCQLDPMKYKQKHLQSFIWLWPSIISFFHSFRFFCRTVNPSKQSLKQIQSYPLSFFSIFHAACAMCIKFNDSSSDISYLFVFFKLLSEQFQLVVGKFIIMSFHCEEVEKSISLDDTRISHFLFIDFGSHYH